MTTRIMRALLGSSAFVVLAGCQSDSAMRPDVQFSEPTPSAAKNVRTLAIELTMPSRNDGGMIFTVEGPNIVDITPASGFDIVTSRAESHNRTTITALVVGPLRNGVIAWLTVQGTNSGQPFDAAVTEVAAGATDGYVQRTDAGAYKVTVVR